jgi:hypothetical protein
LLWQKSVSPFLKMQNPSTKSSKCPNAKYLSMHVCQESSIEKMIDYISHRPNLNIEKLPLKKFIDFYPSPTRLVFSISSE